jgi:hypothetical protein
MLVVGRGMVEKPEHASVSALNLSLEFSCRVVGITVCVKMDKLTDDALLQRALMFTKRRR